MSADDSNTTPSSDISEQKAGSVRFLNLFDFNVAQVQAGVGPFLVTVE